MKKPVFLAISIVIIIVAILAGIKALQIKTMIDGGKKFVQPPETVTTTTSVAQTWDTAITATGTVTAVQGVTVSAEMPGKVTKIFFQPGASVKKGDILLQQDVSTEEAQLSGILSQMTFSRANLKRTEQLYKEGIISQVDHDQAMTNNSQSSSQVESLRATIAKKTVRAPFAGRLGLRLVNLGQILREGEPIVTLQTMNPVFVDFSLPQQELSRIHSGFTVRISGDTLGKETIVGKITTISPIVDPDTRNVKIQATVSNKGEKLRPGMFVNASVGLPVKNSVLVIPATSVLYAPYSDSVFVVEKSKDGKGLTLRQQFVKIGDKRGDFVAITSGLKAGENIVSTGVFKLRNGQSVVVDNKLSPDFQKAPKPENN